MKVIVIGGLHHNTLGVIRSLGEAKVAKDDLQVLLVGARIKKDNYILGDPLKLIDSFDIRRAYNLSRWTIFLFILIQFIILFIILLVL